SGFLKDDRDATNRAAMAKPAAVARRSADENAKGGPSRNRDTNNRVANESSAETMTVKEKTEDRKREEQSAQPRSAGGHKFRKQGSAWVDEKFKSSMSVKS